MNNSSQPGTVTSQREQLNLTTKLAYGAGELGGAIPNNILVFLYYFPLPMLPD